MPKHFKLIIFFICLFFFCHPATLVAQENVPKSEPNAGEKEGDKYILTLRNITENLNDLETQINNRQKDLKSSRSPEEKKRISEEIELLNQQLEVMRNNFVKIATGADLSALEEKAEKEFDWKQETLDLLKPAVQEIKKLTERPRRIENLRNQIAYYETRLPIVQKAVDNIRGLLKQAKDKSVKRELTELEKAWDRKAQQMKNQLDVLNIQLQDKLKEKKPFWESAQNLMKIFFKSRGRNLLLALCAFISVFILLRLLHRGIYRYTPVARIRERPLYVRLFDVFYHILTALGSILALMAVLYIYTDWVLLTVCIIFIFGFIWAAKQNIPKYWEQIKIMLNLAGVREDERIIYRGVPWKVISLNIYSIFENPALKERIRLPVHKLVDMESYPYDKQMPWFPCEKGDWVILSDGTRGEVIRQNHESVILKLRGDAQKTYLTGDFLSMTPLNLSHDFRIKVTFGIDYQHQPICTTDVPEKLKAFLTEKLNQAGYKNSIRQINVEFESAAASSLDLVVIGDFTGDVAPLYNRIKRAIQRYAVEACNTYGWEIPFTQVTVHTADDTSEKAAEPVTGQAC